LAIGWKKLSTKRQIGKNKDERMNSSSNLQLKAALYARVSSEEQVEGYSIDAQRRAFRQLCAEKNWTIYLEYVEEGKSAHTDDLRKRPIFREAINDALAGKYDVLVVHKIDRFSRKLRVTLEYFEKLGKAGVGFVSIQNNMDYSTPTGKFMLVMQGGLAELYSDNLSEETKKGWHERRKQGLYCGSLPFGAMKAEDGVPVPDMQERKSELNGQEITVRNYEGLQLAFKSSAQGKSDREVAMVLNATGYRTTGTHGPRPFSRDTVKGMLVNKFYIGYIQDGNGGWLEAKHKPFIDSGLFEEVQTMRQKNRTSTHQHTVQTKNIYSLTGMVFCWYCREKGHEGRIHISCVKNGKPRMGCYNRAKGWDCPQKSASLDLYEQQLRDYLEMFVIPEDYQQQILDIHKKLQGSYDVEKEQKQLQARLGRLKELYKWGDIGREEYHSEKDEIEGQLAKLTPFKTSAEPLKRLAEFLASVTIAWDKADNEQRNKLARCLFQEVWVKDREVVAVKPQPEFEPFFKLNWEEFSKVMKSRGQAPSGSLTVAMGSPRLCD
jgi:DNA invertase Pin-like site-specific DNA recombinase